MHVFRIPVHGYNGPQIIHLNQPPFQHKHIDQYHKLWLVSWNNDKSSAMKTWKDRESRLNIANCINNTPQQGDQLYFSKLWTIQLRRVGQALKDFFKHLHFQAARIERNAWSWLFLWFKWKRGVLSRIVVKETMFSF